MATSKYVDRSEIISISKKGYLSDDTPRAVFKRNVEKSSEISSSQFTLGNVCSQTIQQDTTIIVECQNKALFTNDIKLNKLLKNSIFSNTGISNVSKNYVKNLLIIRVKSSDKSVLQNILSLKRLGEFSINCRLPLNHATTAGVIGPIGHETDLEELKKELNMDYPEISKVDRIFKSKGKEKTPTLCLKLTFDKEKLPEYLYFGYQRLKVKVFIDKPWQCFHCQGFGHNAIECKSKARCLLCAGGHEFRNCPKKTNDQPVASMKCANCNGDHAANYGGCPRVKTAKKVEEVRAKNKLSYRDAAMAVKSNKEKVIVPNVEPKLNHNGNQKSIKVSIGTQTSSETQTPPVDNLSTPDMILNVVNIILEVINSKKFDINSITNITKDFMSSHRRTMSTSDTSSDESLESMYSSVSGRKPEKAGIDIKPDDKRSRSSSRDKKIKGKKKSKRIHNV